MSLPPPICPISETALMDEAAVALGCDLAALMERAGTCLARAAHRLAPSGPVLVACGPGNNGGDGWVCARLLHQEGREVLVFPVLPPASPLCLAAERACPPGVRRLDALPETRPALVVDAVLGAGTRGEPREPIASALRGLIRLGAPILAADVPSGLGSTLCLPARLTVCLQVAKSELLQQPGLGEFTTVDIGIPQAAYCEVQPCCLRRFPPLLHNGHKGQHGELLVIGGGAFPGALEFAARAGLMCGCDMVRAWTGEGPPLPPTLVVHRQPNQVLQPASPSELTPILARASAVLVGPGIGRSPGSLEAARQAFSLCWEMGVPMVLDADAIAACAELLRSMPEGDTRLLLTPHRGEVRGLLGQPADDLQVHAWARRDRVVLAKGPVDLVTDGLRWQRNPRGNPRLAVGGTGDLLAGLCAGLMARGAAPFDAARMAVLWLTTAGDALWLEQGPCFDALGLCARLPATLRSLLQALDAWPPVTG